MAIGTALVIHPDIRVKPARLQAEVAQTAATQPMLRPIRYVLAEAVRLAQSIGLQVLGTEVVRLDKAQPATLLGRGAIDMLACQLPRREAAGVSECLVIVNASLTAVQQRNLERAFNAKVIDRTALILEIFGARATSSVGRLQVELAALSFQRSRLVRSWTHLERQRGGGRGGGGFLGGPGERQIELDRRMLASRIGRIKSELGRVARTRHIQRQHRARQEAATIALIGYTNAGKSSLFNALTDAGVVAADRLFATLDPSMRGLRLPSGRRVVLADTVGFISQLPTELIAAFKSTLEEVVRADVLLHVHDVASPVAIDEAADVAGVLDQLGLDEATREARVVHVFNKCDLLGEAGMAGSAGENGRALANGRAGEAGLYEALVRRYRRGVLVSATRGDGLAALLAGLDAQLGKGERNITIAVPFGAGEARAWLYRHGSVVAVRRDDAGGSEYISVMLSAANLERFERLWPDTRTGAGVC